MYTRQFPTMWAECKARGLCGTRTEPSWDREKRLHTCCQSKTWWRHKFDCPRATGDGKLPPE